MKKILALCGSIRSESSNMGILLGIQSLQKIDIYSDIDKFPHFNPDLACPTVVMDFKAQIKGCDILLISTPEYAHGIPGVLKNALDWIVSDENFPGKKVALIFASTGDGQEVRRSLCEVLRTMSADVSELRILNIQGVRSKISKSGEFLNLEIKSEVEEYLKNLMKG